MKQHTNKQLKDTQAVVLTRRGHITHRIKIQWHTTHGNWKGWNWWTSAYCGMACDAPGLVDTHVWFVLFTGQTCVVGCEIPTSSLITGQLNKRPWWCDEDCLLHTPNSLSLKVLLIWLLSCPSHHDQSVKTWGYESEFVAPAINCWQTCTLSSYSKSTSESFTLKSYLHQHCVLSCVEHQIASYWQIL